MMRVVLTYAVVVVVFFLCAILQVSLLPYVSILGAVPNLLFVVFFAVIFFQKKQDALFGFALAILAGFLLDMITPLPFGVSMVMLLGIYVIYRGMTRFLAESDTNTIIWYYLGTFLGLLLAYNALLFIASKLVVISVQFGASTVVALAYNLVLSAVVFFVWQSVFGKRTENNQLTLL